MHSVLEQRKQWQKHYISIGKTDLFYNSMGLYGNFINLNLLVHLEILFTMMYILKSLERDVLSYFLVFLRLWREGIWW